MEGTFRNVCLFEHYSFYYTPKHPQTQKIESFFYSEEVQGKQKNLESYDKMDLDLTNFIGAYILIRGGCIPNFKGGYLLA